MKGLLPKAFVIYLIKFGGIFCAFYFGTLIVIGLSSEEHVYSPFVARYLDFVTPLRQSLLSVSAFVLQRFGFSTFQSDDYTLSLSASGDNVRIVYSCVGYGVLSFWGAFVLANESSVIKKAYWLIGGWLLLYLINVGRICILLFALHRSGSNDFSIDHHTIFNVVAYGFIFLLIFFYSRNERAALTDA